MPKQINGISIFKTHFQEWKINIGHLKVNNIWKKRFYIFFCQKNQIISEIYIDQVFEPLVILFYKECFKEIGKIIYINNSALYYMSKYIKSFVLK